MKKLILLIFPAIIFAQQLQTGDLIFQNISCGAMCEAINAVTESGEARDMSHTGMIIRQDDHILILAASGNDVELTPWEKFSVRTEKSVDIGRLLPEHQQLIEYAVTYGLLQ